APGACSLEACGGDTTAVITGHIAWRELMAHAPLEPHTRHWFEETLRDVGDATHVRFNIYPDGGVARLRLVGRPKQRRRGRPGPGRGQAGVGPGSDPGPTPSEELRCRCVDDVAGIEHT